MATEEPNIGRDLYNRGWRQGRILRAAEVPVPVVFWQTVTTRSSSTRKGKAPPAEQWSLQTKQAGPDDYLLIASQDCDITKPVEDGDPYSEPHIEVLRASWESDPGRINTARGKSYHYLLVATRDEDGRREGLIADAAWRALLDKRSLNALRPEFFDPTQGAISTVVVQDWLGARFNRVALPDDIVEAVQRPLVDAIRKLNKTNRLHAIMEKMGYIMCAVRAQGSPMEIELWFVVDEDGNVPSIPWAEAAELAVWIESVLKKKGTAKVVDWERYTTDMLSFRQFNNSYVLALDQFSATE